MLATLIAQFAQHDGDFATAIPAVRLYRRSLPSEAVPCIYGLGLTVAAQGRKRLMLGGEAIDYGAGQALLTTIDVPVLSHIREASAARPYLGLLLALDAAMLARMAAEMDGPATRKNERPLSPLHLDATLHDALCRLLAALNEPPALRAQIAPLIEQEIGARLLAGGQGARLRRAVMEGSPARQIARSVAWIQRNFQQPIAIGQLAAQAHMSASTFRLHFRAVCGMSPLQYIKHIRLQQARQLLWTQRLDAAEAAHRVGYASASQFTREYKRLFGHPPLRDARRQGAP